MVIKVETYRFWFVNLWKKIADFPAVWGGRTQQFLLGHWQRFFVIEPLLKKKAMIFNLSLEHEINIQTEKKERIQ